jgi:hypothetical protein
MFFLPILILFFCFFQNWGALYSEAFCIRANTPVTRHIFPSLMPPSPQLPYFTEYNAQCFPLISCYKIVMLKYSGKYCNPFVVRFFQI